MLHKGQIVEIPANSPIYKKDIPHFNSLKEELLWKSNQIKYTLFDGFILGGHFGIEDFRLGQRKGLGVSGTNGPVYVIAKDLQAHRLFVGQGKNHPALHRDFLEFPIRRVTFNEDLDISNLENNLHQDGLQVELLPHNSSNKIPALLLIVEETIFLKFTDAIGIDVQDTSSKIFYQGKLLMEIK